MSAVPLLTPRTWVGMPDYTIDSGARCFVQSASKFGSRHTTRGLDDIAILDDNAMTQLSIAVMSIGADDLDPGQRACATHARLHPPRA